MHTEEVSAARPLQPVCMVLLLALGAAACNDEDLAPPPEDAVSEEVDIQGFAFEPERLEVPTGAEVVWTNQDAVDHTVTSRDDEFDSGTMNEGDTFAHNFSEPGTFEYRCLIHPTMTGTVVVGS